MIDALLLEARLLHLEARLSALESKSSSPTTRFIYRGGTRPQPPTFRMQSRPAVVIPPGEDAYLPDLLPFPEAVS